MKVHCLQHTSFETPGCIVQWAHKNNTKFSVTNTYLGNALPDLEEIDLLIILGGPQSARKLESYPYLASEIHFIQRAIEKNKAVLGICLGAQLIGEALGARTEKSPEPEIGVFPLRLFPEAQTDPIFSQFPPSFDTAHWHQDMPGMAEGMTWLAASEACPRQIFRYGDRVYGLQCHLEMMQCNVKKLIEHCKDDLTPGLYIQETEIFLNTDFDVINQKMLTVLDYLKSRVS